jgi:hypothetical protein
MGQMVEDLRNAGAIPGGPAKAPAATPPAAAAPTPAPASTPPAADPGGIKTTGLKGGTTSQGFGTKPDGSYGVPSYYKTKGTGTTGGNGEKDTQDVKPIAALNNVSQPTLDKIPTTKTGIGSKDASGNTVMGSGSFHESAYGSYSGGTGLADPEKGDAKWKVDSSGKGGIDVGAG